MAKYPITKRTITVPREQCKVYILDEPTDPPPVTDSIDQYPIHRKRQMGVIGRKFPRGKYPVGESNEE